MTGNDDLAWFGILIVEDDPLLLIDAVDMAEDAGFTAYAARNADEAIERMRKHADIRILFTDVDMPGSMDGLRLAHYVRDRWPPVEIIVVSGLRHIPLEEMPASSLFFAKPYPQKPLLDAFAGAVSRAAAR